MLSTYDTKARLSLSRKDDLRPMDRFHCQTRFVCDDSQQRGCRAGGTPALLFPVLQRFHTEIPPSLLWRDARPVWELSAIGG
jgi:hypothetical protein